MKISTKGCYGVRFLIDLATHAANGKVTLKEVAQRQAISEKYLWQIVNPLKLAGLIRAVAGPHGGYALARKPASITLRKILAVLEGDCALVSCVSAPTTCPRSSTCGSRGAWEEVDNKLSAALEGITLDDMTCKERAMVEQAAPGYNI
ncbi:MAG: Rrf2 family transcriptional regulator [Lentisphaerae bacterium]|nr:Rrf2 family transcriptional regulator [Lentisphaerota bacterium]